MDPKKANKAAELARLRADARRLDWLITESNEARIDWLSDSFWDALEDGDDVLAAARATIDAAMPKDMLDDAMYRKEYSQQSRDMLALLDSYEALVQAAREELGPTGHTQGCRFVLNDGRRECDCIGQQVRQYDGEALVRDATDLLELQKAVK